MKSRMRLELHTKERKLGWAHLGLSSPNITSCRALGDSCSASWGLWRELTTMKRTSGEQFEFSIFPSNSIVRIKDDFRSSDGSESPD